MSKKKVLHIGHAVGGVDVYIRQIISHINTDKFELIIAHGTDDTKENYVDKNGNSIKEYKIGISRNIHPIKDFVATMKLISIIQNEKPDVIHAHSSKGGVLARVASLFYKTKVLYTPNAFSFLSTSNKLKRSIFIGVEKVLKPFSILLASSYSEAKRGLNQVGFDTSNVIVFENSVPPITEEQTQKASSITLPEKYICSIGRPSYQKNIEEMVEVYRKVSQKVPDVYMVLMGVGFYSPNLDNVKRLLKEYQLENKFILIPWISREDVFPVIKKSLLYISTARYEGLPYSIIESLSIGKACVVSDCDGNRDLVDHAQNGFVIPEEELSDKMPDAILELIHNPELRTQFEQQSKEKFEQRYNIYNNISKMEAIYLKYAN